MVMMRRHGGLIPYGVKEITGRYTHRAHRVVHRARTALRFLPTLSCIFHIFSGWQGRGGLRGKHTTTEASTPSFSPMVVVAAHTPCQGRAVGRGRRGCRTLRYGRHGELDETKAFPPGFLIHAGCHDKNQMRKTLSGLHNGKNKRRNQMENKQEQGD